MGLNYTDLLLLEEAARETGPVQSILTIGRLNLYLHPREVQYLAEARPGSMAGYSWASYCEPYLKRLLGAATIQALDFSDYEGADIIHDMNLALPSDMDQRFDIVIDGGSLEHIFNFPTAVLNVMRMAKVGGHVLISNPSNNLCGHGFYQFSPELMFRVLSPTNGYSMTKMLLTEHDFAHVERTPERQAVIVRDPKDVGRRALITAGRPTLVRSLAKKTAHIEAFPQPPQQSDYAEAWAKGTASADPSGGRIKSIGRVIYRSLMPARILRRVDNYRNRYNLTNRAFFTPYAASRRPPRV